MLGIFFQVWRKRKCPVCKGKMSLDIETSKYEYIWTCPRCKIKVDTTVYTYDNF